MREDLKYLHQTMFRSSVCILFGLLLRLATADLLESYVDLGIGGHIAPFVTESYRGIDISSRFLTIIQYPNLSPPSFAVTTHNRSAVSPGYWFVAPYTEDGLPDNQCRVGPHIYDNDGVSYNTADSVALLIYFRILCGLELAPPRNRPAFDFRVYNVEGTTHLSYILGKEKGYEDSGLGLLLTPSFEIYRTISALVDTDEFDIHELNIVDNGKNALIITSNRSRSETPSTFLERLETELGHPVDKEGFVELEILTGKLLFAWSAFDHIDLSEASIDGPGMVKSHARDGGLV